MSAIEVKDVNGEFVSVPMRADASLPRYYRRITGRDIFRDMQKLEAATGSGVDLDGETLEMFEDIAYVMAKHADPEGVPDTADEWLEQFSLFSIWEVLPKIIKLWRVNIKPITDVKKNLGRQNGH